MSEFHVTMMGRKFFESDVPGIRKALEDIARALAAQARVADDAVTRAVVDAHRDPDVERAVASDLLRALLLVVAIAEDPKGNPHATVKLDPKAEEQVRRAIDAARFFGIGAR